MQKPAQYQRWRCVSSASNVQIWERMDQEGRYQRQFRANGLRISIYGQKSDEPVTEDVYEGGIEVWNGTLHLFAYLAFMDDAKKAKYRSRRVVDIGCGNGILGIFFAKHLSAECVVFQDLNDEVRQTCTIPNVKLNEFDPNSERFKFLTGFWSECFASLTKNSFDIIVTSDTVYRIKNYKNLHDSFDLLLSHEPDARIFVCGQVFYFGNDGGIRAFSEFITSQGTFQVDHVEVTESISVQHQIIILKRTTKNNNIPLAAGSSRNSLAMKF